MGWLGWWSMRGAHRETNLLCRVLRRCALPMCASCSRAPLQQGPVPTPCRRVPVGRRVPVPPQPPSWVRRPRGGWPLQARTFQESFAAAAVTVRCLILTPCLLVTGVGAQRSRHAGGQLARAPGGAGGVPQERAVQHIQGVSRKRRRCSRQRRWRPRALWASVPAIAGCTIGQAHTHNSSQTVSELASCCQPFLATPPPTRPPFHAPNAPAPQPPLHREQRRV